MSEIIILLETPLENDEFDDFKRTSAFIIILCLYSLIYTIFAMNFNFFICVICFILNWHTICKTCTVLQCSLYTILQLEPFILVFFLQKLSGAASVNGGELWILDFQHLLIIQENIYKICQKANTSLFTGTLFCAKIGLQSQHIISTKFTGLDQESMHSQRLTDQCGLWHGCIIRQEKNSYKPFKLRKSNQV